MRATTTSLATLPRAFLAAFGVALSYHAGVTHAATFSVINSGIWNNPATWTPGGGPPGAADHARVGAGAPGISPATVTLGGSVTVDTVTLGNCLVNFLGSTITSDVLHVIGDANLNRQGGGFQTDFANVSVNGTLVLQGVDSVTRYMSVAGDSSLTLNKAFTLIEGVQVTGGFLDVYANLTAPNVFMSGTSSVLNLEDTTLTADELTLQASSGPNKIDGGNVQLDAVRLFSGSQFAIDAADNLTESIYIDGVGSTLTLNRTLNLSGFIEAFGGVLEVNQNLAATGLTMFSANAAVNLNGATLSGGFMTLEDSSSGPNKAGGGNVQLEAIYVGGGSTFAIDAADNVTGFLLVDGVGSVLTLNRNIALNNAAEVYDGGRLALNNSSLSAFSTTLFGGSAGGVLAGRGTIVGLLDNGGRVAPGFSPGIINVVGDYTQSVDGELEIEVAGLIDDTLYDQLFVTGAATLAGRLTVPFLNGFVPAVNDQFTFLTAASVTGQFDAVFMPNPSGRAIELIYDATSVRIRFVDPTVAIQQPNLPATTEWSLPSTWITPVPTSTSVVDLTNATSGALTLDVAAQDATAHQLQISGGASTTTVSVQTGRSLTVTAGVEIQDQGIVELNGGTLATTEVTVADGGTLQGNGTVSGDLVIGEATGSATLSPGFSVGMVEVNGDYTQNAGGEILLEINGLGSFDEIDISGVANFGGTLTVELNDGSIGAGEELAVITAGSLEPGSKFDRVRTVGGGDIHFRPVYDESDPDQLIVRLQSFTFTPGDMNGSGGDPDADDAAAIALALRDPVAFALGNPLGMDAVEAGDRHPVGPGGLDGDFDFDDVLVIFEEHFSTVMSFGQFTEILNEAAVPEPAAAVLGLVGVAAFAVHGRRRRLHPPQACYTASLKSERIFDKVTGDR